MSTFFEAIEQERLTLTRSNDTPVAPFGYGADLSCLSDVGPNFEEIDPFSTQAILESSVRRLDTPRGSLPDGGDPEDLEYGYDLVGKLNHPMTVLDRAETEGRASSEVEKDDRVRSASVTILSFDLGRRMRISITIQPVDPNLDEISGTFAITPEGTVAE